MPVYPYNEVRPRLGERVFIAPGAIPAGQLALGVPARVARPLTDGERALIPEIAARYTRLKDEYREMLSREAP